MSAACEYVEGVIERTLGAIIGLSESRDMRGILSVYVLEYEGDK